VGGVGRGGWRWGGRGKGKWMGEGEAGNTVRAEGMEQIKVDVTFILEGRESS
jgi:hypothetical protein